MHFTYSSLEPMFIIIYYSKVVVVKCRHNNMNVNYVNVFDIILQMRHFIVKMDVSRILDTLCSLHVQQKICLYILLVCNIRDIYV